MAWPSSLSRARPMQCPARPKCGAVSGPRDDNPVFVGQSRPGGCAEDSCIKKPAQKKAVSPIARMWGFDGVMGDKAVALHADQRERKRPPAPPPRLARETKGLITPLASPMAGGRTSSKAAYPRQSRPHRSLTPAKSKGTKSTLRPDGRQRTMPGSHRCVQPAPAVVLARCRQYQPQ